METNLTFADLRTGSLTLLVRRLGDAGEVSPAAIKRAEELVHPMALPYLENYVSGVAIPAADVVADLTEKAAALELAAAAVRKAAELVAPEPGKVVLAPQVGIRPAGQQIRVFDDAEGGT